MNYNFKRNKINGDRAENEFKALCIHYNKEIKDSTFHEDKYKHIDLYVNLKNKIESVDVKAIKKVYGEYNNDLYYIELINDYGYPGWIHSKDLDLIAFENVNEYNIYHRKDILNFIENEKKKKYKEITRKLHFCNTYSKCILLPKRDIEHFKYYELKKTK
jgi:hypothetical protein